MIRATGSNTIAKSYVQGTVNAADREKFFAFLAKSSALRNQQADGEVIALHAAYQIFTLRRDGKKSEWIRPLPDRKEGFYEVEERLWSLPLQERRPFGWKAVRRSSWYE